MKLRVLGAVAMLITATVTVGADAEVKFAGMFTDGMVLQQQADVAMRGTAVPGGKVSVKVPWARKVYETRSDAEGLWSVVVSTPSAGGPYDIVVTDKDGAKILSDVLVGDVWVCGGQSNMEMPMRGFPGQPVHGTIDMIARVDSRRPLRLFKQPKVWSTSPRADLDSVRWDVVTPASVGDFSAVGYVFGDCVQRVIDIPVGLIQCCWSNSKIEAWMPRDVFTGSFQEVELPVDGQTEFGWLEGTPTLLYNAMVNPWQGFPVKGVIWYQGEANSPDPDMYMRLFPEMVESWRNVFVNDTMPVYYVQLVPHNAGDPDAMGWARFREVQARLQDDVPGVGMVTTGDVGDSIFIHAPEKIKVGERLAYLALNDTYHRAGADVKAPIARACSYNAKENSIWVTFDNMGNGLIPTQRVLDGFEIVDSKGDVHKAVARTYGGNGVAVWSPVEDPVEVRYGYHNYYEASLFNNMYIPASPFKMKINKP